MDETDRANQADAADQALRADRGPTTRTYAGPEDFAIMSAIATRSWILGRPLSSHTAGDIEWWTVNDPDQQLAGRARLWLLDGEPVGWEWPDPPGAVDWHLRPGLDRRPYLEPMLDRLEAGAAAAAAAGSEGPVIGLDGRLAQAPIAAATTWAMDTDTQAVDLLTGRDYAPDGLAHSHWLRRLPSGGGPPIPEVTLPAGYRHASVRWPDDVPNRAEVHRSAFAPSRMTIEKYRHLIDKPHYDPARDRVIVAPDGSFAAFANAWLDSEAQVGELEPVGTHADHRRLGLARAVCLEAFRVLDAAGARECLIFSGRHNVASEALYESLGCERVSTSRRYAKPVG
jgi:ribosomal protein S18 acetylase RimI-like enzyme